MKFTARNSISEARFFFQKGRLDSARLGDGDREEREREKGTRGPVNSLRALSKGTSEKFFAAATARDH